MEKKEKKADLEQLLNSLIEKGWKPRGYEDVYEFKLYKLGYTIARPQKQKMISFATETRHYINGTDYIGYKGYSLRELVSKESGLWQFVCENGMVKHEVYEDIQSWEHTTAEHSDFWYTSGDNYEFYVIESSLKDESELESFILDNIKVEGKV